MDGLVKNANLNSTVAKGAHGYKLDQFLRKQQQNVHLSSLWAVTRSSGRLPPPLQFFRIYVSASCAPSAH